MIAFAYNNNVYLSINRVFNELFKDYVADFVNGFESRLIKRKISFSVERGEWLRNNKKYLREL